MAKIDMTFMSESLTKEVSVKVFLPTDFTAMFPVEQPYKTVYFFPGYSASKEQIASFLTMRTESELKGLAIVIPDGDNSFYQDVPVRNANYSTFVSKELVEFTRSLFPLSDRREDTYIGGISMGGYGALYNGLTHPETFSKIAALSPGLELYDLPEFSGLPAALMDQYFGSREAFHSSDADVVTAFLKDRERPELFLGCGRQDVLVWDMNKRFHESLIDAGIPHEWMEIDGNHDLYTWSRMLDRAFSFLTGIEPGSREKFAL